MRRHCSQYPSKRTFFFRTVSVVCKDRGWRGHRKIHTKVDNSTAAKAPKWGDVVLLDQNGDLAITIDSIDRPMRRKSKAFGLTVSSEMSGVIFVTRS